MESELHEKAKYMEVNQKQQNDIDYIRMWFSNIYEVIDKTCEPGRETSLAFTKLEEAQMWAIKSISREKQEETVTLYADGKKYAEVNVKEDE